MTKKGQQQEEHINRKTMVDGTTLTHGIQVITRNETIALTEIAKTSRACGNLQGGPRETTTTTTTGGVNALTDVVINHFHRRDHPSDRHLEAIEAIIETI
jgi:hypothetical protein